MMLQTTPPIATLNSTPHRPKTRTRTLSHSAAMEGKVEIRTLGGYLLNAAELGMEEEERKPKEDFATIRERNSTPGGLMKRAQMRRAGMRLIKRLGLKV